MRAGRDSQRAASALEALRHAAAQPAGTPDANLLALAIDAARARCTVGEISSALEDVYGRYRQAAKLAPGAYGQAYAGSDNGDLEAVRSAVAEFERNHGRPPRLLVAKAGQDGHTRGANVIATAFSDMGFDVDLGPLFSTPQEVVNAAIENDVDVVGLSSLAAGHNTLAPAIVDELRKVGRALERATLTSSCPAARRKRHHHHCGRRGARE